MWCSECEMNSILISWSFFSLHCTVPVRSFETTKMHGNAVPMRFGVFLIMGTAFPCVPLEMTTDFGANVLCIRKISRVPKSEGERSLVPFEYAIVLLRIINFRFRRVLDKNVRSALGSSQKKLGWRSPITLPLGGFWLTRWPTIMFVLATC